MLLSFLNITLLLFPPGTPVSSTQWKCSQLYVGHRCLKVTNLPTEYIVSFDWFIWYHITRHLLQDSLHTARHHSLFDHCHTYEGFCTQNHRKGIIPYRTNSGSCKNNLFCTDSWIHSYRSDPVKVQMPLSHRSRLVEDTDHLVSTHGRGESLVLEKDCLSLSTFLFAT